jgi:uncharacterized protein involved in exopolysaccharide biosynthesis
VNVDRRTAWIAAVAIVSALALSGAVAFLRTSAPARREQIGEGSAF